MRFFQIFLMLAWASGFAAASGNPSLDEIVKKALDADEKLRAERQRYEFDYTVTTEKLDEENDEVWDSHTAKGILKPGRENRFASPLDEPDKELSERDVRRMKDSDKAFRTMKLKKLAPRFDLTLKGTEEVRGIPCYAIEFHPKQGQPYDSREEKVINALEGTFWVDQKSYAIVKSKARLPKPVSVAWVFATMRELEFEYSTQELPNGAIGPHRFDLFYHLQVTMTYRRRKQLSLMEDYRLMEN